jgi:hypothetical protein
MLLSGMLKSCSKSNSQLPLGNLSSKMTPTSFSNSTTPNSSWSWGDKKCYMRGKNTVWHTRTILNGGWFFGYPSSPLSSCRHLAWLHVMCDVWCALFQQHDNNCSYVASCSLVTDGAVISLVPFGSSGCVGEIHLCFARWSWALASVGGLQEDRYRWWFQEKIRRRYRAPSPNLASKSPHVKSELKKLDTQLPLEDWIYTTQNQWSLAKVQKDEFTVD